MRRRCPWQAATDCGDPWGLPLQAVASRRRPPPLHVPRHLLWLATAVPWHVPCVLPRHSMKSAPRHATAVYGDPCLASRHSIAIRVSQSVAILRTTTPSRGRNPWHALAIQAMGQSMASRGWQAMAGHGNPCQATATRTKPWQAIESRGKPWQQAATSRGRHP